MYLAGRLLLICAMKRPFLEVFETCFRWMEWWKTQSKRENRPKHANDQKKCQKTHPAKIGNLHAAQLTQVVKKHPFKRQVCGYVCVPYQKHTHSARGKRKVCKRNFWKWSHVNANCCASLHRFKVWSFKVQSHKFQSSKSSSDLA